MNNLGKRIGLSLILLFILSGFLEYSRTQGQKVVEMKKIEEEKVTDLTLWYTNENLLPYLELVAQKFYEANGVRVHYEQVSSGDYIRQISEASISTEAETPDVYLLRNDMLESAYMAGLAQKNADDEIYNTGHFAQTALDAVTYHEMYVAYPFYYDIVCMLYNREYFADSPATMEAITNFAETVELTENVEKILNWNINDYFYNYTFLGNYLDIAGEAGDDRKSLAVVSEQTLSCLASFHDLGQYFAVDNTVTAESVLQEFLEGKTLCTLADSEMVQKVEQAKNQDMTSVNFGIGKVPDINADLVTRGAAYTEVAVVNGMSTKQGMAAELAKCITYDCVDDLYVTSGCFPAKKGIVYANEELSKMYDIYERQKQFPKLLETEDLWMKLDVLFSNVRNGADVGTELQNFSSQLTERLE